MRQSEVVLRGLTHYRRTHVAVVLGVGVAVTVLAGAFIVGDSMRASLRDLVLQRLGRTDTVLTSSSSTPLREQLAEDLGADPAFAADLAAACPHDRSTGVAADQASGRRASQGQVFCVRTAADR